MVRTAIMFIFYMAELCYSHKANGIDYSSYLDVTVHTFNDSFAQIISLTCSSTIQIHGCGVQILLDNKTVDEIRFVNHVCYNTKGKCTANTCRCSNGCQTFKVNYTDLSKKEMFTFTCIARLEDKIYANALHVATISKLYNSTGSFNIASFSKNDVESSTKITTSKNDISNEQDPETIIIIIICVTLTTTVFGILGAMINKRRRKRTDFKEPYKRSQVLYNTHRISEYEARPLLQMRHDSLLSSEDNDFKKPYNTTHVLFSTRRISECESCPPLHQEISLGNNDMSVTVHQVIHHHPDSNMSFEILYDRVQTNMETETEHAEKCIIQENDHFNDGRQDSLSYDGSPVKNLIDGHNDSYAIFYDRVHNDIEDENDATLIHENDLYDDDSGYTSSVC